MQKFSKLNEQVNSVIKKLSEVQPNDILDVKPEYGGGKIQVIQLHYGRQGIIEGVITNRGIMHRDSFVNIKAD
jgi:hypothetical protein